MGLIHHMIILPSAQSGTSYTHFHQNSKLSQSRTDPAWYSLLFFIAFILFNQEKRFFRFYGRERKLHNLVALFFLVNVILKTEQKQPHMLEYISESVTQEPPTWGVQHAQRHNPLVIQLQMKSQQISIHPQILTGIRGHTLGFYRTN